MSEPVQKCVNNAISNQNYAQKLFTAFKTAYSCCCGLRGNLDLLLKNKSLLLVVLVILG